MMNLDSVLKSRHITLPTNVSIVKAIVSPTVMYRCENWTIKKSECWRTDAFELWFWRRFLRFPWAARRANQSIVKEINPEYSSEGLMLNWNSNTLATWWEEPTHWKRPWGWARLMAGEGDNRGWDGWMASPNRWTWVWASSGRQWKTRKPCLPCLAWRTGVLQSMGSQRVRHDWATEWQQSVPQCAARSQLCTQWMMWVAWNWPVFTPQKLANVKNQDFLPPGEPVIKYLLEYHCLTPLASSTRWTWVWVNSRSWWWTGKPGVLQSKGLQRAGYDWATELNWLDPCLPHLFQFPEWAILIHTYDSCTCYSFYLNDLPHSLVLVNSSSLSFFFSFKNLW